MLKETKINFKKAIKVVNEFENATRFAFYQADAKQIEFIRVIDKDITEWLIIKDQTQKILFFELVGDNKINKGLSFELLQPLSNLVDGLGFEKVEE